MEPAHWPPLTVLKECVPLTTHVIYIFVAQGARNQVNTTGRIISYVCACEGGVRGQLLDIKIKVTSYKKKITSLDLSTCSYHLHIPAKQSLIANIPLNSQLDKIEN